MLGHVFANTSTFICILQYQYNILPLWSLSQQCFKTKSPGGFFKHILLDPSALTPRAPLFSVSCFGGRMRQKTRMLPRSSWWNLITSIWGTGVYHRFGIVVIFVFYWRCWKRSCCHRIPSTCLRWMRWPFEAFFYVFSTPKSSRNLRGLRTLAPCRTVWSLFIHLENIFLTTLSCWVASLTAEHSNWMQLSSWDWLISIGVGVESSFCHLFIILVANTLIFTVTWCLVTEFWPCTQPNHRIRHWLEYTRSWKGSAGQGSNDWTFILKTQLAWCRDSVLLLWKVQTTGAKCCNHYGHDQPWQTASRCLGDKQNIIYSSCNAGSQNKHNKDPRNSGTNTNLQSIA